MLHVTDVSPQGIVTNLFYSLLTIYVCHRLPLYYKIRKCVFYSREWSHSKINKTCVFYSKDVVVVRQKVRVVPPVDSQNEGESHAGIHNLQIQHAESTYVLVVKIEILL